MSGLIRSSVCTAATSVRLILEAVTDPEISPPSLEDQEVPAALAA